MPVSETNVIPVEWLWWMVPLMIWDLVWRGMALWQAAKNEQKKWFVALILLNTAGILPIIYLKFFQKRNERV